MGYSKNEISDWMEKERVFCRKSEELEMLGEAMRAMMAAGGEIPSLIMLVKSLPVTNGLSLGMPAISPISFK